MTTKIGSITMLYGLYNYVKFQLHRPSSFQGQGFPCPRILASFMRVLILAGMGVVSGLQHSFPTKIEIG